MSAKRIYNVYKTETDDPDDEWLIRATSRSQAISHVARSLLGCRVATQEDLVAMLQKGRTIIDAGVDGEMGASDAES